MVGAPRQATFVVVDATSSSRRLAARALRRLGFVNLVTGVFWPVHETRTTDPEQSILSPIYSGPDRLIFEFVRAEVVWSLRNGNAGVRFAAIDGATGRVGTRDRPLDSGLYRSLLDRCRGQLAGDPLLFPPRQDLHRKPTRIPRGLPLLDFPGN